MRCLLKLEFQLLTRLMNIIRTWKPIDSNDTRIVWDRGSEFWEMLGDTIRHFSVVERTQSSSDIIETVQLLEDDLPIPLEAIRNTVKGWSITEVVSEGKDSEEKIHEGKGTDEPWTSLSQWIPPNALYQPSLHHQAFLELQSIEGKQQQQKRPLPLPLPLQKQTQKQKQPQKEKRPMFIQEN